MAKRKENESVEKIASRKTIIAEVIIGLAFILVYIMIALVSDRIVTLIITGIVYIILYFIICPLLEKEYKKQETYKYNERICKRKLSEKRYTKVIPKYYTEFIDDLQNNKNVEFYAKLAEKGKVVVISKKYKGEEKYMEDERYFSSCFPDYYEIVKKIKN